LLLLQLQLRSLSSPLLPLLKMLPCNKRGKKPSVDHDASWPRTVSTNKYQHPAGAKFHLTTAATNTNFHTVVVRTIRT